MSIQKPLESGGFYAGSIYIQMGYSFLKNKKASYFEYKELNIGIEDFAYTWHNHIRPHAFNGNKTPYETRYTA